MSARRFWRRVFSNRTHRVSRSRSGNFFMFLFVFVVALFCALPLVLSIGMSLKPINELYVFPPTLWPRNATFDNYKMLFSLINSTRVAFSRYAFNTVFITVITTAIHVIIASMAAYPLSKGRFPGKNFLNQMVLLALMFVPAIADVINYQTIVSLGWLDTYMAAVAPNVATTLGLFLITNYMATIPDTLLEAARIDGCSDFRIYRTIVMPICKPAWLTLIIIMFQNVWGQTHTAYIYKEAMKTLPYALTQITTGGYIRAGAAQSVGVLMLIVPAIIFVFNQTKILETMASSGIKE
ncbi:MAG: carbohydrate ABC transporter permease [Clostridia bacterium]|nr:carbohydrate ABC transporter permease [Clostridia bacterium]